MQVEVKGDDIFVSADENALQSGKRKPTCTKAKAANGKKVVIVGGGAGGNAAAEALREVRITCFFYHLTNFSTGRLRWRYYHHLQGKLPTH